jgi:translation initiation factor IF-3
VPAQPEEEPIKTEYRVNRQIRAPKVRLISETGEQVGIVDIDDARRRAEVAGLDLVEVAPDADPPVCRIYDFKKVLYEQKRKLRESRKKAKVVEVKEIKLRINIDKHDLETKINHAREFLERGDKVKFTIQLRGREVTKQDILQRLVVQVMGLIKDIAELEQPPSWQGRTHSFIVTRAKTAGSTGTKKTGDAPAAAGKP